MAPVRAGSKPSRGCQKSSMSDETAGGEESLRPVIAATRIFCAGLGFGQKILSGRLYLRPICGQRNGVHQASSRTADAIVLGCPRALGRSMVMTSVLCHGRKSCLHRAMSLVAGLVMFSVVTTAEAAFIIPTGRGLSTSDCDGLGHQNARSVGDVLPRKLAMQKQWDGPLGSVDQALLPVDGTVPGMGGVLISGYAGINSAIISSQFDWTTACRSDDQVYDLWRAPVIRELGCDLLRPPRVRHTQSYVYI